MCSKNTKQIEKDLKGLREGIKCLKNTKQTKKRPKGVEGRDKVLEKHTTNI